MVRQMEGDRMVYCGLSGKWKEQAGGAILNMVAEIRAASIVPAPKN